MEPSKRAGRAALASAAATAVLLAGAAAPASAAVLTMTLSSSYGPTGGGDTIVGTVPSTLAVAPPFPAGTTPTVQFQYIGTGSTGCGTSAKAITQIAGSGTATTAGVLTADPASVKRITASKIAFKVPSGPYPGRTENSSGLVLVGTQAQGRWNVCVYNNDSTTSSTLLASAVYTVALVPRISTVSPASSPAAGGQTITVTGTGFTPGASMITGAAGDVALSNVKVALDGQSFTATTGSRVAGTGLALTVVTPGGTVSSLDPDNDPSTSDTPIPFSYTNGIAISPSTAASGTQVTVDVTGVGFSALTFEAAGNPTSARAHVFLVDDAYQSSGNRGVAECVVDSVISDRELVCTLDLAADQLSPANSAVVAGSPITDGAYILTVVADGSVGAGDPKASIVSSGAAFVVAPY
jgi:hypothetical protein